MYQRFLLERAFTEVARGARYASVRETQAAITESAAHETDEQTWTAAIGWLRRADERNGSALVTAIWSSGDPLVRLNLIQRLDPARPAELRWLTRMAREARVDEDTRELYAIALKSHPALCQGVLRRNGLPAALKTAVEHACVGYGGAS